MLGGPSLALKSIALVQLPNHSIKATQHHLEIAIQEISRPDMEDGKPTNIAYGGGALLFPLLPSFTKQEKPLGFNTIMFQGQMFSFSRTNTF